MKTRLASLFVAGLCLLSPAAFAQTEADDQNVEMVNGTVVSTGSSALVVTTENGVQRTFATTEKTLLPATALAVGDHVSVKFRTVDANRAEAVDVSVVDLEPDSAAAPTAAAVAPTPPVAPMAAAPGPVAPAPETLPATASTTPLLALVGVLALAAALAVRGGSRLLQ
jgi:translation initiation factor IF-1